jgi:PAS domain S-box-containing protein
MEKGSAKPVPIQQHLFPTRPGMAVSLFEDDARYQQIFRSNPAIQILLDPVNGRIIDANDAACNFYGYDCDLFPTLTVFDLNTLPRREALRKIKKAMEERGGFFHFTHLLADGSTRQVEVFTTPVTIRGRDVLYSTIHDVTDRLEAEKKQASESARELREQRERLASRIETIEEERRKISRELHDGVGQLLTAAYLNLELVEDAINENSGEAVKLLHKVRKLLDKTIQETRNISHDLRPAVLDDFGLIPGLRMLAEEFSDATGIKAIFQHFQMDARLDPRLETTIYRICQEALNNIARHSGATEAAIEIFRKGCLLTFTVNDNGSGIPAGYQDHRSFRAGTGLNNIKERVDLHNGRMQIISQKKSGTELLIEIPLS